MPLGMETCNNKHIRQILPRGNRLSHVPPPPPCGSGSALRWEVFPIDITRYVTVVCVASWVSFWRSIDVAAIITRPSFTPTPALSFCDSDLLMYRCDARRSEEEAAPESQGRCGEAPTLEPTPRKYPVLMIWHLIRALWDVLLMLRPLLGVGGSNTSRRKPPAPHTQKCVCLGLRSKLQRGN